MGYKDLIDRLQEHEQSWAAYNDHDLSVALQEAADTIGTLLAEREAAVRDLTEVCKDNPDVLKMYVCQLCNHSPCSDGNGNGHCIGFQWRGPTPPDRQQTES